MKQILTALALVAFACFSAEAQCKKVACEAPKGKVCKKYNGRTACYKTKYAHDFKVCKDEFGYRVCCEEPNRYNSTNYALRQDAASNPGYNPMEAREPEYVAVIVEQGPAPESQSYPDYGRNSAAYYEGYYTGRHTIKVCYGGDNVAELNRAAYHGCYTPANGSPETNKARNVNSNNVIDAIPPISGQIQ